MTQAKSTPPKCTIGVYPDKGSLRLSFSTRYNALLEQLGQPARRQHTFALNLPDTEQNRKRAMQAAIDIEADLQHKDWVKLFDPTFAKYGIGDAKFAQKLADVIQMPTATPQMTVGEMWEDYLVWKEGQLQPTTFKTTFLGTYTNALKGLKWDNKTQLFIDTKLGGWQLPLSEEIGATIAYSLIELINPDNRSRLLSALKEATDRAIQSGKLQLAKNPFYQLHKEVDVSTKDMYAPKQDADGVWREWWEFEDDEDEYNKDVRAFTITERDAIIKAFYEADSDAKRHAAPLIEFLFLTGCRHGEAFGLRWKDVSFERGYVRFSKSYNKNAGTTQQTKTGTIRMFKLYPKLTELLLRIKPADASTGDLVFKMINGGAYGIHNVRNVWNKSHYTTKGFKHTYPGIVTKLAQEGVIGGYLKPYSTRHTFITLQAHAGADLVLLAASCGNSVEMIHRHYLGIRQDAELISI